MQHLGIFTQIPGPKISNKITKKSPMGRKTRAAIARAKNLSKKQQKTDIFSIEDSPDTQPEGFSCKNSDTNNCCCQKTLFCQVDFQTQKSKLKEIIESCGHICDFYPKFYCELNLLNSIGELQNCVTVGLPGWSGQWLWSRMSKNVLMVFHLSKFVCMIILFPILGN